MEKYWEGTSLGPRSMLPNEGNQDNYVTWAIGFAWKTVGRRRNIVQRFSKDVPEGYGSWLVRVRDTSGQNVPTIALNSSQIANWAANYARKHRGFLKEIIGDYAEQCRLGNRDDSPMKLV